ncbi:hypothetical protein Nepgr_016364 [Nepenthes gracilis]|uniref:Uncharacterized protein n=1 Tax=Nepenthes gracilis TaxID=150966 RepID=A0AAD3SMK0_NEPGR|nr:hypothetical protein Nepgr_016364 [Nepenthes gracilis]
MPCGSGAPNAGSVKAADASYCLQFNADAVVGAICCCKLALLLLCLDTAGSAIPSCCCCSRLAPICLLIDTVIGYLAGLDLGPFLLGVTSAAAAGVFCRRWIVGGMQLPFAAS